MSFSKQTLITNDYDVDKARKFFTKIHIHNKKIRTNQSSKKLFAVYENSSNNFKSSNNKNFSILNDDNNLDKSFNSSLIKLSVLKSPRNNRNKILIVDDNDFINNSVKQVMEKIIAEFKLDLDVIQASDGIDMIKLIVEDQRDGNLIKCVFTDEYMEYINGSEAIRIIRSLEKENKIKINIIFSISSGEDNDHRNMILNTGADDVLGKPVSKSVIVNSLKNFKIII